jgi:hypothetical protein
MFYGYKDIKIWSSKSYMLYGLLGLCGVDYREDGLDVLRVIWDVND